MRAGLARFRRAAAWTSAVVLAGAAGCAQTGSGNGGGTNFVVPPLVPSSQELGGGGDDAAEYWQVDTKADRQFRAATRLGDNLFRFEVRDFEKVAQKQTSEETCWAACASMILRLRRDTVDERYLAELITGGSEGKAATIDGITRALAYRHEKKFKGSILRSSLSPKPLTNEEAIESISRNRPILIGIKEHEGDEMGHAVVALAVEFRRLREGFLKNQPWQVVAIDAYDPYPGAPEVMRLEHADILEKIQFTVTPESAEKAVREWSRR